MTTQQPEALRLAEILEGGYSLAWLYEHGGYEVSAELRRQHARITALEAQLEAVGAGGVGPLIASAGFDAADMATASAQGFRDGVASLTAQAADSVQEDAARYRFIRDVPYSDDVRSVLVHQQNAAMDRVIDAAMNKGGAA